MFTSGNWIVKAGKEKEFIETWKAFSDAVRGTTQGTEYAYLLRDADNPSHFISFGEWKDISRIQTWRQSSEFKSFMQKFDTLCESHKITTLETVITVGKLQEAAR